MLSRLVSLLVHELATLTSFGVCLGATSRCTPRWCSWSTAAYARRYRRSRGMPAGNRSRARAACGGAGRRIVPRRPTQTAAPRVRSCPCPLAFDSVLVTVSSSAAYVASVTAVPGLTVGSVISTTLGYHYFLEFLKEEFAEEKLLAIRVRWLARWLARLRSKRVGSSHVVWACGRPFGSFGWRRVTRTC